MSHNIDKIYYINLNKRVDRKERIEKELDKFELKYDRFEAIETPGFGIYGCGLSHLAVLRLAKENNYENVLILEDDFTFLVSKNEFEKQLNSFFDLKIHFDVLMISYNLYRFENTKYEIVNKVIEAQTASGYIVNKCYYDKLINLYEWSNPILIQTKKEGIYANDQIWKQLQRIDTWYCFTTRIGKQAPGYSDNMEKFVNYNV
jgi:glycosyl transferase family 25